MLTDEELATIRGKQVGRRCTASTSTGVVYAGDFEEALDDTDALLDEVRRLRAEVARLGGHIADLDDQLDQARRQG